MPPETVCLLGFGEVGQALAKDLDALGYLELRTFDIQFADPKSVPSRAVARATGVQRAESAVAAAEDADLLISAVTAAEDYAAAASVAGSIGKGAWFLDLNSVAPGTRQAVAALVESSGGRYVEAAVMSPILPEGAASPILLGGPHGAAFAAAARGLGFQGAEVFSDEIGRASAAKMCRSVVVKGLEALLTESMLAARRYGVEQTVLDTLGNVIAGDDWESRARYLLSRSLEHGARRAEEMREVSATVAEAGIEPWMSEACVERQARSASFGTRAGDESLAALLDRLLADHYAANGGATRG